MTSVTVRSDVRSSSPSTLLIRPRAFVLARQQLLFRLATALVTLHLLDDTFIMKDLYKIRGVTDFAHARPYLLSDLPEALSQALREYLRVDGVPKGVKQKKMLAMLRGAFPLGRTLRDALDARKLLGL